MATSHFELGQRGRNVLLHEGQMMLTTTTTHPLSHNSRTVEVLPDTFLSCYEIVNRDALRWGVRLYKVRRVGGGQSHAERGEAKQAIWSLRKKYKDLCGGYGFVVDVDEETIAVPSNWNLPSGVREGEYQVALDSEFTTEPTNRQHRAVIAGILREGIKKHFKDNRSDVLGDWWQDFDRFCEMPDYQNASEFHFCRKFVRLRKC